MHFVCVGLHVTVDYITAAQCFMVNVTGSNANYTYRFLKEIIF